MSEDSASFPSRTLIIYCYDLSPQLINTSRGWEWYSICIMLVDIFSNTYLLKAAYKWSEFLLLAAIQCKENVCDSSQVLHDSRNRCTILSKGILKDLNVLNTIQSSHFARHHTQLLEIYCL